MRGNWNFKEFVQNHQRFNYKIKGKLNLNRSGQSLNHDKGQKQLPCFLQLSYIQTSSILFVIIRWEVTKNDGSTATLFFFCSYVPWFCSYNICL